MFISEEREKIDIGFHVVKSILRTAEKITGFSNGGFNVLWMLLTPKKAV